MTYRKDGTEYLEDDEYQVYQAIRKLNRQGRTTNNSQVANVAGINRTRTGRAAARLDARGYIRNAGKGAAYHWRLTGKEALREGGPDTNDCAACRTGRGRHSCGLSGLQDMLRIG